MRTGCAAEAAACLGDSTCGAFYTCWAACEPSDGECRSRCHDTLATNALAGDVATCALRECQSVCRVGSSPITERCESCSLSACEAAVVACSEDSDCLARLRCGYEQNLFAEPNPARSVACNDQLGVYAPRLQGEERAPSRFMELAICIGLNCGAQCGAGERLDCGTYAFTPVYSAARVSLRVESGAAFRELPATPLEHAAIRACRMNDRTCSDPEAAGVTDRFGSLVLELRGGLTNVYFETEVELGGEVVRTIDYPPGPFQGDAVHPVSYGASQHLFSDAAGYNGLVWERGTGLLVVYARDCHGFLAKDVAFRIRDDSNAQVAHYPNLPRFEPASPTIPSGFGAYIVNITPGLRVVEAYRDGRVFATKDIIVRADWTTTVDWLYPDPQ
jgi:hypothetical protein